MRYGGPFKEERVLAMRPNVDARTVVITWYC